MALKVAVSSVIKWAQRQRSTGSAAPGQMGGHRRPLIAGADRDWALAEVERTPHVTLATLAAGLAARGLKIHPAEQVTRPKLARRREQWRRYQGRIDPRRLVFLDETWVKTNMAPLRGWGDRSKRLVAHVPHGHWKTMTFIAALRCNRFDAPWVLDGPINGEVFKTYVEVELIRTLTLLGRICYSRYLYRVRDGTGVYVVDMVELTGL